MFSIALRAASASAALLENPHVRNSCAWWMRCLALLAVLLSATAGAARAQSGPPVHSFSSPQGAHLPLAPIDLTLDNPFSLPLRWGTAQPVYWLDLSPMQGMVPPGSSLPLRATVNQAAAA
jgi:hypothetical protein